MCGRIVRILLFFCALCLGAHSGAARVSTVRPVRPTAEGFYQKPSL